MRVRVGCPLIVRPACHCRVIGDDPLWLSLLVLSLLVKHVVQASWADDLRTPFRTLIFYHYQFWQGNDIGYCVSPKPTPGQGLNLHLGICDSVLARQ